ncbi:MAG: pentapeptide repeat-containing protein, partial [Pseudomonadota bacterium]
MNKPNRILDWLRLYGLDDILKWHRLGTGIGWAITAFGLIFAALFVVVIVQTFLVLFSGKLGDTPLRGLSFLLAFFVGAPFVIWRSVVAQRQVDTAAAALFNDKVNAATAELAARKEVTRVVGKRDKERVLTTWKDDLVRRAAAIDRLEGLAKEEPDEARRIARLLCVYVKELSRQEKPVPCTVELKDIDWTDAAVQRKTLSDLQDWSRKLVLDRTDMERAVHSLAALNTQIQAAEADKHAPPVIDLEGTNLQAMRLSGLNLTNANMTGTAMQGAVLIGAEMQGAVLSWAQMQGAVLFEAEMQGADLREAEMQG